MKKYKLKTNGYLNDCVTYVAIQFIKNYTDSSVLPFPKA